MSEEAVTTPGLSQPEVEARMRAGQVNTLPPRSGRTLAGIIRTNVFTRINAMLGALLMLVAVTGSWKNGLFGLLIVINSVVGITQEIRAKRTLDRLAIVGEARPTVRRAGVATRIDRRQVVVDDIIELQPGDQVVVDGEIVESRHLQIDEALLTGESDPMAKMSGATVLSGSFVVAGSGAYRATRVGANAYAEQLAAEASRYTLVKSELRSGINTILRGVTWLLVPVGLLTIWVQLGQLDSGRNEAILQLVGALVPMVPEGLVLLTSVAFAVGVIRLGARGCLVQELPAIEGLARVDTVCIDKTGTLTEPGLAFGELIVAPDAGIGVDQLREFAAQLAATDPHPNPTMRVIADEVGRSTEPWPVTTLAPFTSSTKWSGASFTPASDRPTSVLLGAVDVLAAPGSPIVRQAEVLAATGLRVVGLATSSLPVRDLDAVTQLQVVGLVVLQQKVRPEAAGTVAYFAREGVEVKVISGDHASSVAAVARSVGIGDESSSHVVDARQLPSDPELLADEVEAHAVFGRVTPEQKRAMVRALQRRGHVVAMTGDGVNDVLALKDSDIGVAMGSGSEASRSVAQFVLLNDNFATLPDVVAEGRRVIGNIERVAVLFLTKTFYAVLLAMMIGFARLPFPFVPLHVTITAWFTIGVPAFLLSLAPNPARARPGFVRRALARSAPAGISIATVTFATYLYLRSVLQVASATQVSTACLVVVIGVAMWVLIVVTRPDVLWKWLLILGGVVAYTVLFGVPVLARFFMLDATNGAAMQVAAVAVAAGIALCELGWRLERWVSKGRPRRSSARANGEPTGD